MTYRVQTDLYVELYHHVISVESQRLASGLTAQTVKLECGHELAGVTADALRAGDLVRCPKCG